MWKKPIKTTQDCLKYCFLKVMLWQGVVEYWGKKGFGNLVSDSKQILKAVQEIRWG